MLVITICSVQIEMLNIRHVSGITVEHG